MIGAGITDARPPLLQEPGERERGVVTGLPLLDSLVGLGSSAGVSAGSLLLYASAATGAYALWEQLRFRMARWEQKAPGTV